MCLFLCCCQRSGHRSIRSCKIVLALVAEGERMTSKKYKFQKCTFITLNCSVRRCLTLMTEQQFTKTAQ